MFIVISILFSAFTFAQTIEVSNLLKQLDKMQFSPNQCTEPSNDQELYQQCARELCGPPEKLIHSQLLDGNFDDYVKLGTMNNMAEIETPIKELVKHTVDKNKLLIEKIKAQINDNKLHYEFEIWSPNDFHLYAEQIYEKHLEFNGKQSGRLIDRLTITPIYPEGASEAFKKGLEAYAKSQKERILSDPRMSIQSGIYTEAEAKEILSRKWAQIVDQIEKSKEAKPELKNYADTILKTTEEIKTLKGVDAILDAYYQVENLEWNLNRIINGKAPTYQPLQYCYTKDCQEGVKDYLLNFGTSQVIENLEKANDPEKLANKYLAYCRSELASLNLEESDRDTFMKLAPAVMKRVMERTTKGYSAHSKAALEKHFKDINLTFKNATPYSANDFFNRIEEEYKDIQSTPPYVYGEHPKDLIGQLLRLRGETDGVDPLAHLTVCQPFIQNMMNDAFYPKGFEGEQEDFNPDKHNIHISKFSCTHHEVGKHVFAHELGHALSYAFQEQMLSQSSFKAFQQLRSCANEKYTNPSAADQEALIVFNGDTLRTEEDTADLISYMTFADEPTLSECSTLDLSADGKSYVGLSLENEYKEDSHSSGFLRVLTETIHKRKEIPESCQKIMDASPEFRFKKCF